MAELEKAAAALRDTLKKAGINAVAAMPWGGKRRFTEPVAAVWVKNGSGTDAGFSGYLGRELDSESGLWQEIYGKRLDIDFNLYIYSPDDGKYGAQGCMEVFGDAAEALGGLPSGLKLRRISCGETRYDRDTGMFRLEAEIECRAFMYAVGSDSGEITDFNLKGAAKV